MKKINAGRRGFLKQAALLPVLGLPSGPVATFINAIVQGTYKNAVAESINEDLRNYVYIHFFGAPPRWSYDCWLTPGDDNSAFSFPPMTANRYAMDGSGQYVAGSYETVRYVSSFGKAVNLPLLWRSNLPARNGGVAPMTNIADNMMVIRGIDMERDGHELNYISQQIPVPGEDSLGGRISASTGRLFSGVGLTSSGLAAAYRSKIGQSQLTRVIGKDSGNVLNNLLVPFSRDRSLRTVQLRERHAAAIESAIAALNSVTLTNPNLAKVFAANRSQAELRLRKGLDGLDDFWQATFPKYLELTRRALNWRITPLYGISDAPIAGHSIGNAALGNFDRRYSYSVSREGSFVGNGDVRTIITNESSLEHMASEFAVAEYLLQEGLSSYVSMEIAPIQQLSIYSTLANLQETISIEHDQHLTGQMVGTFLNAHFFAAYAACLNEFIRVLKSRLQGTGSAFDKTVIHSAGEFNRAPRVDGSGSDHGFYAQSISLHCGAIRGPLCLGNIRDQAPSELADLATYPGTWGFSAANSMSGIPGSFSIKMGHVGESIATLLGVPGLSVNAFSLITKDGAPLLEVGRTTRA